MISTGTSANSDLLLVATLASTGALSQAPRQRNKRSRMRPFHVVARRRGNKHTKGNFIDQDFFNHNGSVREQIYSGIEKPNKKTENYRPTHTSIPSAQRFGRHGSRSKKAPRLGKNPKVECSSLRTPCLPFCIRIDFIVASRSSGARKVKWRSRRLRRWIFSCKT